MGEIAPDKLSLLGQFSQFANSIGKLLEKEITQFTQGMAKDISDVLSYLFQQGGKRLRPTFFVYLSRQFDDSVNLGPYALAIELIHTMSLYHDDVIDGASERRGAPTVHKKWDIPTAIVGGDILHSQIHRYLLLAAENNQIDLSTTVEFLKELLDIEVEIGSYVLREMWTAKQNGLPSLDLALEISAGKTAPLFAFSSKAAAIVTGQKEIASVLYDFGYRFGIAFQLLDDILDYFHTDKDIGGDLREGKKTPLVVLAAQLNPEILSLLKSSSTLSNEEIIRFRKDNKQAFQTVVQWIEEHLKAAREILAKINLLDRLDILFDLIQSKLDIIKHQL